MGYLLIPPPVTVYFDEPLSTANDISCIFFLNWCSGKWNQLSPLGTAATNRPIVPGPNNYDDGEFGGMKTGRVKTKVL
jgi:hypothetical protein